MTYTAEDLAAIDQASTGQVLTALAEALRLREMGAAAELTRILATKDPQAADLIVRTVQYRCPTTSIKEATR